MGALFLDVLDKWMEASGLFYVRFIDDWIVLTPTRWKLRKAVRVVNETLAELHVEQHPEKTFVGRVSHGFWFLGYTFGPAENLETKKAGLTGVAPPTWKKFVERVNQLYEQDATRGRIEDYIRRWLIWVKGGLGELARLISVVCEDLRMPKPTRPNKLLT
jgi:RNA-directed DNA polymerase